jgi:alkylation response protein AidB-like acyl-CoA dehydrogenase
VSVSMAFRVPVEDIGRHAEDVDREARFPTEAIAALRQAGLLGLGIPDTYGGPGGGPGEIVEAIREVSGACGSTGMVYTMHLVAAQTLLAGTDGDGPAADALREIAAGRHLSTLAYSERATRSHFWAQASRAELTGDGVRITADKSWVTAASHADSYVVATGAPGETSPTSTELYLVPADSDGIEVAGGFDGLGMRGNDSSAVRLTDVHVSEGRRLGEPGSGFELMLSATLPWFVLGCAACCVGLAGGALATACRHVSEARLEHLGTSLAEVPAVRTRLAAAQIDLMQAQALLDQTARQVEEDDPAAQLGVLALKAAAAEMAIRVTDEAMRACGGAAYSRHLPLERSFRDARAATIMAPTTDILRDLLGKAITGQELFD